MWYGAIDSRMNNLPLDTPHQAMLSTTSLLFCCDWEMTAFCPPYALIVLVTYLPVAVLMWLPCVNLLHPLQTVFVLSCPCEVGGEWICHNETNCVSVCYLSQCLEDVVGGVDWTRDGQRQSSQVVASEDRLGCREDADKLVYVLALPLPPGLWTVLNHVYM